MSGSVVSPSGTSTTIGLQPMDRVRAADPSILVPSQVKVYNTQTDDAFDVVIDLQTLRKVAPHDGGGWTPVRHGVIPLTRDEALNLIRAIQRSLGINPDALVLAIEAVEDASGPDTEDNWKAADDADALYEAYENLYVAAALSIGAQTASDREAQS